MADEVAEDRAEDRAAAGQGGRPAPSSTYQRASICISSQVGCAVNCQFCLTAKLGIRRNLTAGEIAGQVAAVLNRHRVNLGSSRGNPTPDRINLVFMGMGEALPQLPRLHRRRPPALGSHADPRCPDDRLHLRHPPRHPSLCRRDRAPQSSPSRSTPRTIPCASHHADHAQVEHRRAHGGALDHPRYAPARAVTFEYVLLGGINDQPEHAAELIALLQAPTAPIRSRST